MGIYVLPKGNEEENIKFILYWLLSKSINYTRCFTLISKIKLNALILSKLIWMSKIHCVPN